MLRRPLRALRVLLVASVTLVLWTFARPARAAAPAPFCDDRGASSIAPAPALEASDVAVQRARATPACPGEELPLGTAISRGRAPSAPAVLLADPVLPATRAPLVAPPGSRLDSPSTAESPPDGERSRVERPPRG
jgi:hypothetical protein